MMNKIKTLVEDLLGKRKLNIYQRVLRLSLLGSLLTFVVMVGLYKSRACVGFARLN